MVDKKLARQVDRAARGLFPLCPLYTSQMIGPFSFVNDRFRLRRRELGHATAKTGRKRSCLTWKWPKWSTVQSGDCAEKPALCGSQMIVLALGTAEYSAKLSKPSENGHA